MPFPELIHLFFNGHHLEGAQLLGVLEFLHVEGAKARVVEAPGKDPKGVAHEDLVYPMATHQVRGGQLDEMARTSSLTSGSKW